VRRGRRSSHSRANCSARKRTFLLQAEAASIEKRAALRADVGGKPTGMGLSGGETFGEATSPKMIANRFVP